MSLEDFIQGGSNGPVSPGGGVLVDQGGSGVVVAHAGHEVSQACPGLGGEGVPWMPEIMEVQARPPNLRDDLPPLHDLIEVARQIVFPPSVVNTNECGHSFTCVSGLSTPLIHQNSGGYLRRGSQSFILGRSMPSLPSGMPFQRLNGLSWRCGAHAKSPVHDSRPVVRQRCPYGSRSGTTLPDSTEQASRSTRHIQIP